MKALNAAEHVRRCGVLVVVALALGLGIGLGMTATRVLASHDDPDTIHACVNPLSKVARIVENPARCAYYEELVEWQSASGTSNLEARIAALEQANTDQQGQIDGLIDENADQQGEIGALQTQVGTLETTVGTLQTQVGTLQTTIGTLETNLGTLATTVGNLETWQADRACIQTAAGVNPAVMDIVFNACNVHVRDGSGDTGNLPNGLGNLIVGYNEESTEGDIRTGSHNLVIGSEHSYPNFGGFVAGFNNTISGSAASVTGGNDNEARGTYSSVSGGLGNVASGFYSSVSGGEGNTASAAASSVAGGARGTANGTYDTVVGDSDGGPAFDAATGSLIFADAFITP